MSVTLSSGMGPMNSKMGAPIFGGVVPPFMGESEANDSAEKLFWGSFWGERFGVGATKALRLGASPHTKFLLGL